MSTKISNYIASVLCLDRDEHAKLKYSLQVVLGEISKLVLLFLIFFSMGWHQEFGMAVVSLTLLRLYTGGLHFKTYVGCLTFSLMFFTAVIFLSQSYALSQGTMLTLGLGSLAVIAVIAPVTSKNRPNYNKKQRFIFKIVGCTVIYLHIVGAVTIKNNPYFTVAMWVIFLQTVQLLIAKGMTYYEKKIQL